jgi:hypothetical protein
MTPDHFRRLALALPEAVEGAHQGHADFRVGGRIFATLGYPNADSAMVKLSPELQEIISAAEPAVFRPVPGGWGRKGATLVHLPAAGTEAVSGPLTSAWRRVAPRRLASAVAEGGQGQAG